MDNDLMSKWQALTAELISWGANARDMVEFIEDTAGWAE